MTPQGDWSQSCFTFIGLVFCVRNPGVYCGQTSWAKSQLCLICHYVRLYVLYTAIIYTLITSYM